MRQIARRAKRMHPKIKGRMYAWLFCLHCRVRMVRVFPRDGRMYILVDHAQLSQARVVCRACGTAREFISCRTK